MPFIALSFENLKPTHIPFFPVHLLTLTLARCIGISFESRNSFQKINIQIRSQVKVRVVKAQFPLEISAGSMFLFSPFFLFPLLNTTSVAQPPRVSHIQCKPFL